MKKLILGLAFVATSFGAFAAQTPATTSKKEAPKTEKKAEKKAEKKMKKEAEKKEAPAVPAKTTQPKKG